MFDAEFGFERLPDLVDPPSVLMGADGQGGGEPREAVLLGVLRGPAHPQPVADRAPAPALRLLLQTGDGGIELLRVVAVFHDGHAQRVGRRHETLQLLAAAVVFCSRPGVGVVVEHGDLEVLAQLLQHGAGTGAAAGVEQELRPGGAERFQHFVHLLCKIQLL